MKIRPYKHTDEQELLQIWLQASVSGHPFIAESYWKSQLKVVQTEYLPASETFVATQNNKLTGFVSLLDNLIGGLFVLPQEQGKQIGTQLINFCATQRKQPLEVEVYQKNLRAQKFYKKCGFVFTDARTDEATNEVLYRLVMLV